MLQIFLDRKGSTVRIERSFFSISNCSIRLESTWCCSLKQSIHDCPRICSNTNFLFQFSFIVISDRPFDFFKTLQFFLQLSFTNDSYSHLRFNIGVAFKRSTHETNCENAHKSCQTNKRSSSFPNNYIKGNNNLCTGSPVSSIPR